LGEVVEKIRLWTGSASWLRVIRYGCGLGYGHVLVGAAWAVMTARAWTRRGGSTSRGADARDGTPSIGDAVPTDASLRARVAIELALAPIPWFLVFRARVSNHDHEMLYFAPALAFACWSVLEEVRRSLRAGRDDGPRGILRQSLLALMLVATGGAVAADIEHRDDFTEPRELGALIGTLTSPDEPSATSSSEHSVIWAADRFVHLNVKTEADLEALLAKEKLAPRLFVLPERDANLPVAAALARRATGEKHGPFLVFTLGNMRSPKERSR
jgi:hypothetical protein